jgi:hypothetical protein
MLIMNARKKAPLATVIFLVVALSTTQLSEQTRLASSSLSSISVLYPTDSQKLLTGTLNVQFSISSSQWTSASSPTNLVELFIDGTSVKSWSTPLGAMPYSAIHNGLATGMHSLELNMTGWTIGWYTKPDGSEGMHWEQGVLLSSGLINFTAGPPEISNFSIQNQTYNTNQIPLSFNIESDPSWRLGFVLDQKQTPFDGNKTLTLPEGSHNIAINVHDLQGNSVQYDTVSFTVAPQASNPSSTPTSFPTPTPTATPITAQIPSRSPSPTITPKQTDTTLLTVIIVISATLATVIGVAGGAIWFRQRHRRKSQPRQTQLE